MMTDIFDLVKKEETSYKTTPVAIVDGFEWNMYDHIRHCVLIKDGKLLNGSDPEFTPVKNIVLPILNVAYRTEGFDVKDIEPYVDNADNYHKSLLVRKFHETYALENQIDNLIDDIVESYVDFGGVIVKNGAAPEVIPLQQIAFCDQTDILSGPFAIKHQYSVDQLAEKKGIWDSEAIDKVITNARYEKMNVQAQGLKSKTPGKYIEVYEVHGVFPKSWLSQDTPDYVDQDEDNYSRQLHVVVFNVQVDGSEKGMTLFKGKEKEGLFKVLKRDKRFGTALGRSQIEELFEPQAWTNYSLIQKKSMLDKLALMLGVTDDPSFATKNKFTDLAQGEWLVKQPGTVAEPFAFTTSNLNAFDGFTVEMEQHARTLGSASDPQLGLNPSSGTPLGTTQIVTNQGQGIHEYRRGKVAAFVEEIYRDWILPKLVTEMNKGSKFMAELSLDELREVAEKVAINHANKVVKQKILNGDLITPEEQTILVETIKNTFMKAGTKRFHELLKGELDDIPVDVRINVAGKEKNLSAFVDKLSNIIRAVIANPAVLQDPNVVKLLNTSLEASGLSPINFSFNQNQQQGLEQQQPGIPSPLQAPLTTPQ